MAGYKYSYFSKTSSEVITNTAATSTNTPAALPTSINFESIATNNAGYHIDHALFKCTDIKEEEFYDRSIGFPRTIIYLSDAITLYRNQYATMAYSDSIDMDIMQKIVTFLGAITTILVSIKSGFNNNEGTLKHVMIFIGILAIVFSAAGTAASSMVSFYAPRENYLRDSRTLAALDQLHAEIAAFATSLSKEACSFQLPADKMQKIEDKVQGWSNRLTSLINSADTTTAAQSDNKNASSANATIDTTSNRPRTPTKPNQ